MKEFLESVQNSLKEMVTLQIITVVGDVSVTIKGKDVSGINLGDENAAMVTRFNLLTGDITNSFDKQFVTGDYTSLQDFQSQREEQGLNRVKENIAALKELINLARGVDKELQNQPDDGGGDV